MVAFRLPRIDMEYYFDKINKEDFASTQTIRKNDIWREVRKCWFNSPGKQ
jgi:hypothetical protein